MEDNNHIKSPEEVCHLDQLYLNLKDQDVQYDVLESSWPKTKQKKAQTYLLETNIQLQLAILKF